MSARTRNAVRASLALASFACGCFATAGSACADGSLAAVRAAARAGGNRRAEAIALGTILLARTWPAQVTRIRIDGAGTHRVAGLVLSARKFHGPLDRAGFEREVSELVASTFAATSVEEVDCWATVPLAQGVRVIVSGDMAQPTSRIVFGVTVRRAERTTFAARLRRGADVFWARGFLAGGQ